MLLHHLEDDQAASSMDYVAAELRGVRERAAASRRWEVSAQTATGSDKQGYGASSTLRHAAAVARLAKRPAATRSNTPYLRS